MVLVSNEYFYRAVVSALQKIRIFYRNILNGKKRFFLDIDSGSDVIFWAPSGSVRTSFLIIDNFSNFVAYKFFLRNLYFLMSEPKYSLFLCLCVS